MEWLASNFMVLVWVAVMVASVVVEASTLSLVAIWFIPSALVSLLLAFLHVDIGVQVAVWIVGSALFLVFARKIFKKMLKINPVPTNADAMIGRTAVVTQRIDNNACTGEARVRGQMWTARSYDDAVCYEQGEILTVLSIEGVKIICKK